MTQDVEFIVVGAGVAGLAAAAELRRRGRSCLVLEAAHRIGGRAWTVREPALGGIAFDHGASWLHDADHNPLRAIAEAHADRLIDTSTVRHERSFIAGRPASDADLADYTHAEQIFSATLLAHHTQDVSVAAAVDPIRRIPWVTTVETWETSIIAAADATDLSLLDWRSNALQGRNMLLEDGLGAFVSARLGPPAAPVQLATPVQRINWAGPMVSVETPRGTLTARHCIVTVSTGVLRAGAIRFSPHLPPALQQALDGLPMGLLTKVAFATAGADRFDLPPFCSIDRHVDTPGQPTMTFSAWPFGRPMLTGFVGGRAAWDLAAAGPAATRDFALEQMRALFGSRIDLAFSGTEAIVTGWATNPLALGAYCYARPGYADARRRLAENHTDGRLLFAGEACHEGLAGTVAGAWISGRRAATELAQLGGVQAVEGVSP